MTPPGKNLAASLHQKLLQFAFDGADLVAALRATFRRRETAIPAPAPLALTDEFATDVFKNQQWTAFTRKARLRLEPPALPLLTRDLRLFLGAALEALHADTNFESTWNPPGPWSPVS